MKAGQKYFLLVALIIIVSGMMFAQTSTTMNIGVKQENDGTMKISWSIGSEDGIDHYAIFRSTGNTGQFSHIGEVPRGTYSFSDNDLFKTSGKYFRYKVLALRADATIVCQSEVGASYSSTSSAAKRTWGSIKAMFR
ncbi:MAG: hypothetical protein NTX44_02605 [Ignavibacteriales bacterium]|nr:hypothetical protein [Ignavibacteriales bacterium]